MHTHFQILYYIYISKYNKLVSGESKSKPYTKYIYIYNKFIITTTTTVYITYLYYYRLLDYFNKVIKI